MTDMIRPPWTPEQVAVLNRFQQYGGMHPFTCGGKHRHNNPTLEAREDGWHCPATYCDYRQDWAHAFMAEPDKWPSNRPGWSGARSDVGTEFVQQIDHPDEEALAAAEAEFTDEEARNRASDAYRQAVQRIQSSGPKPAAHDDGPSVAECAAADRLWPLQQEGE
ncbi:hypothetical protein [Streptomyces sp. NPDC001492]